MELTHMNEAGRGRMVDVGPKNETEREAIAKATVRMKPETATVIKEGKIKKGDVLAVAQVAGIQGAKRTPDIIPMCHPIRLTSIDLDFRFTSDRELLVTATVKAKDRTGVEMEALSAATVAALTVYDMCKAIDKGMEITDIYLQKKTGGKSGDWLRKNS